MPKYFSDEEVIQAIDTHPNLTVAAQALGMSLRNLNKRRRSLEKTQGIELVAGALTHQELQEIEASRKARITLEKDTCQAVVFSDAHYWPGLVSTAHAAMLEVIHEIQPDFIIGNGDLFDGASMSRHAKINWEETPSAADEVMALQARLGEIESVSGDAEMFYTLGNHDARFESFVANNCPELKEVYGVHLKDHVGECWQPCWAVWLNEMTIKHRWKGGVNAARNNAEKSRRHFVTGHTHQMTAVQIPVWGMDELWGCETGTLSEPFGPQYEAYTEDNPRHWTSGFMVFTWINGHLCQPEMARTVGRGQYEFRREIRELGSSRRKAKKGSTAARTAGRTGQRKTVRAKGKSPSKRNSKA